MVREERGGAAYHTTTVCFGDLKFAVGPSADNARCMVSNEKGTLLGWLCENYGRGFYGGMPGKNCEGRGPERLVAHARERGTRGNGRFAEPSDPQGDRRRSQ
jgi:hypothetical protein